MRFANLLFRTAALTTMIVAASACQTAQKPATLLPPPSAPALKPAPAQASTAPVATIPQKEESPQRPASPEADSTPQAAPASDPVADLIAKVEKEYQTGLANHQAGKNDDAKQNFDNAMNALLGSNLDVRSDERLQKEFDRVVAGVNDLDIGGLGAESEAQQKTEPAPIDETNGITPSADPNVKAKAQAEIKSTRSDLP